MNRGMSHATCFLCKLLMGEDAQPSYVLSHSQFLQHVTHRGWPETDQEHQRLVVSTLDPRACALEKLGIEPQKPSSKRIIARSGYQLCSAGHKGNLTDDVTLSRTLRNLRVFTMEPIIVTNRESVVLLGLTEVRDLKGRKDR